METHAEIHDAVVSDPDIVPTDENFWLNAKVVMPQHKEVVTIRLDADLLAWFRQEKGYQTKISAILRAYRLSHANRPLSAGKGPTVASTNHP